MRVRDIAVIATLLLGACRGAPSPVETPATDAGTIDPDGGNGACVSASDCGGATPVCEAGACRACRKDGECGLNSCLLSGACGKCRDDLDCLAGEACRSGICNPPCQADSDCDLVSVQLLNGTDAGRPPTGAFGCIWGAKQAPYCSGQTERAAYCRACRKDADCASGHCSGGDCGCATNAECAKGLVCSGGRCGGCLADSECAAGEKCQLGRCAPPCHMDSDCAALDPVAGMKCRADGTCGPCANDSDCMAPKRCYADGCVTPCQSDHGCLTQNDCTGSGRCTPCTVYGPVGRDGGM